MEGGGRTGGLGWKGVGGLGGQGVVGWMGVVVEAEWDGYALDV